MSLSKKFNPKNAGQYIERFLKIKTKDNKIKNLKLNQSQKKLYETVKREHEAGKPVRIIILKARQMGFSTATEALIFHSTVTRENVNSQITAHTGESTSNLFNMSKLFYDELPPIMKPLLKASNAKELIFENPTKNQNEKKILPGLRSKIKCTTANASGVGRSDTLTNLHISEYAFWEGDKRSTLTGLMQAVPNLKGTMVIIESTANGYDDFKRLWDSAVSGESDFVPLFFPWFEMKEYRMKASDIILTEEEKELKKAFCLDDEQIAWRRWCIKNNCGGDVRKFREEYPSTPEEAFIMTGECVFDKEELLKNISRMKEPLDVGRFEYSYDGMKITDFHFSKENSGEIKIYEHPKKGVPYVIGGDTSGNGSDRFAGQVIDNVTGKQVAVLCHKYDEDMYARQMYCLGMYYNKALIGIETNFSTYPVRELERLGYPKQYVRESVDNYTHSVKKSYGFVTNSKTRPLLIASLVSAVRDAPENVTDRATAGEMLTFVYNESRRPEAAGGAHDDLVMALGIAFTIRGSQSMTEELPTNKWTKDMLEDYKAANREERKYLLNKWGKPSNK
ncbi:MAG: DNA packaging protein [Ruminococcaceae bacterium]|nr:DNA packaging protein [Oscillospiraceae bacterium]